MIEELLRHADAYLGRADGATESGPRAAYAQLAAAFIARADLAVRMRDAAGGAVEQLKISIREHFWDRATLVVAPDGVTAVISAARYSIDAEKAWEIAKPWRHAGWRVQFVFDRRCEKYGDYPPPYPHHFELAIYNDEKPAKVTGRKVFPYCTSCGFVPPGNNLLEVEIMGPKADQ